MDVNESASKAGAGGVPILSLIRNLKEKTCDKYKINEVVFPEFNEDMTFLYHLTPEPFEILRYGIVAAHHAKPIFNILIRCILFKRK